MIIGLVLFWGAPALAETTASTPQHEPLQKTIGQAKPEIVPSLIVMNARGVSDVAPGRSGEGGATLLGGVGNSAAPMNGYPKVFNIESDPREEHNIGAMYEWVIGPVLKAVEEYKASLMKSPNPPAANMTRF